MSCHKRNNLKEEIYMKIRRPRTSEWQQYQLWVSIELNPQGLGQMGMRNQLKGLPQEFSSLNLTKAKHPKPATGGLP